MPCIPRSTHCLFLGVFLIWIPSLVGCSSEAGAGDDLSTDDVKASEVEVKADAITVKIAPVRKEPVSALYTTSANLRSDAQATVSARTQGVIKKLMVEEGDEVEADQALAILEDDEQQIAFERTTAIREIRKKEFERSEAMVARGVLSENDFEVVRREAEEAKHAAALAELNLTRTVIRAPFSGRIVKRSLDVGAMVRDGTAVYDLADLDPLYADVNVPERSIARLSPGQKVRLLADISKDQYEAVIERIAPAVDPGTGTVKVTLAVPRSDSLRPGTFVRVNVVTDTHENALVVPRSALVADGRRWHLFRLREDGKSVEQVEVSPGFEEGDLVEVFHDEDQTASPIEEGDDVVVVGASALSEGALVEVVEK